MTAGPEAETQLQSDLETLRWLLEFARRDKIRLIEKVQRAVCTTARLNVLYAAVNRLHATLDRAGVLDAIEDIVVNVIGARQTAIFEKDDQSEALELVGGDGVGEDAVTHCIPLRIGSRLVGAIAIGQLREQKKAFTAIDFELFSVLGTHAATALRASRLHEAPKVMGTENGNGEW